MTLAEQIQTAQENNEQRIAAQIRPAVPKYYLDSEALMYLRHWAAYCKSVGVKFCPAMPSSVAAFIRTESAAGVPAERIMAALEAIMKLHDNEGMPNPVSCAAPRNELLRILTPEPPRSWNRTEKLAWPLLPPEVQAALGRMEHEREKVIRRYQNEMAACRKCNMKGNTANESSVKEVS
jgi:hypothetical protein